MPGLPASKRCPFQGKTQECGSAPNVYLEKSYELELELELEPRTGGCRLSRSGDIRRRAESRSRAQCQLRPETKRTVCFERQGMQFHAQLPMMLLAVLVASPIAPANGPECTGVTCLPLFNTSTTPGSGWTIYAISSSPGKSKPGPVRIPCLPCKGGVSWEFYGGFWNQDKWQSTTPGSTTTGSGSASGFYRCSTECDSGPDYFLGEYDPGSGWAIGCFAGLDCVCQ